MTQSEIKQKIQKQLELLLDCEYSDTIVDIQRKIETLLAVHSSGVFADTLGIDDEVLAELKKAFENSGVISSHR